MKIMIVVGDGSAQAHSGRAYKANDGRLYWCASEASLRFRPVDMAHVSHVRPWTEEDSERVIQGATRLPSYW